MSTAKETQQQTSGTGGAEDGRRPIVFFDGVCGLCNRFVDFTVSRDREGRFRFAPLQGETAGAKLSAEERETLSTVILLDEEGKHVRSAAAVRILVGLGGGWKVLGRLLWLVPRPLRDLGYKLVVRFRYRLFGKREACRMPGPEERERFLP